MYEVIKRQQTFYELRNEEKANEKIIEEIDDDIEECDDGNLINIDELDEFLKNYEIEEKSKNSFKADAKADKNSVENEEIDLLELENFIESYHKGIKNN